MKILGLRINFIFFHKRKKKQKQKQRTVMKVGTKDIIGGKKRKKEKKEHLNVTY